MLDLNHTPSVYGIRDVQVFTGKAVVAGAQWETWVKPRGKTMLNIVLLGKGGDGGQCSGGNVSSAGGGASGAQTVLTIPLALLPDRLYLSLAGVGAPTASASYIGVAPNTVANNTLAYAAGGGNGSDAIAISDSTGGAAGAAATAALMPLGWAFQDSILAGQAGGANVGDAAASVAIPVTGLLVTGGTAGGLSGDGGSIVGSGVFPTITSPAATGKAGTKYEGMFYGGTGASAVGSAGDLRNGGDGANGCGGGGAGASTLNSNGGRGGPALAILTCW